MKKFMRIALVFALAGATLVGCTKDYSGDISDLNKKVTEQASALSALQTQVGAAQTAADAAAQKAAEALAEAQKKASSADVQAAEERVNAKINDLVNGDVKALKDAVAALEGIKAGERLTVLETAIKDFVTKAEFAQELAALKDELTAAIAAGDKANADAIAALGKKVEDILASLSINSVKVLNGYKGITAAYGKFTAKGVENAAKWKGPKADEIATIKKGDYVFGTGANEIRVQVNPADADITDAEISLQTSECVEAPIVFGTPVPYEGKLKSENGLWTLPFVVEEFTEEDITDIDDEFNGTKMALVVDGIRTDYDMSFAISKDVSANAPENITEKVAEATGKGTFKFAPADAPKILDAYITGVKREADSLRFGITYDGMSFTYDVEKVKKYVSQKEDKVDIEFIVSYMNLVGTVTSKVPVTLTITYKGEEPAAPTVYTFATVAAHDAVAAYTGTGVSAADKETSRDAQSLVISFKEFYDEFAPTKAEKAVWDEDWHAAATIGFYTAKKNSYDEWETKEAVDDLVEKGTFSAANSKLTIKFKEDYGTDAKLDGTDSFAAVVTFTNDEHETIEAVVPFKINAPSATEKAKWFNWNGQHAFNGSALEIKKSSSDFTEIDLKSHFNASAGYKNVQLLAPIDSSKNTSEQMEYFPGIKLPKFDANVAARIEGMNSDQIKEYKQKVTYRDDMRADFAQLNWDNPAGNTNVKYDTTDPTTGYYKYPYWQFNSNAGYDRYNSLILYFWNASTYAYKYLNTNLTVSGLKLSAMGGREFSIPDLTIRVVGNVESTPTISFAPALEIDRNNFNFISLYNGLYNPDVDAAEFFGSFALKDATGKALKLSEYGKDYTYKINTYTATELGEDKKPVWSEKDKGAVIAYAFKYTSQVTEHGTPTAVGGLKISNSAVSNLNADVDTLYVKIEIAKDAVLYVLDGSPYGAKSENLVVTFEIKIK